MKKITIVAIVSLIVSFGLHAGWLNNCHQPLSEVDRRLEALQANRQKYAKLEVNPGAPTVKILF